MMIITKQMTENDILRTNLQYYWNNFSESEQKWLISHIALEQDKTLIYKDDSWRDCNSTSLYYKKDGEWVLYDRSCIKH